MLKPHLPFRNCHHTGEWNWWWQSRTENVESFCWGTCGGTWEHLLVYANLVNEEIENISLISTELTGNQCVAFPAMPLSQALELNEILTIISFPSYLMFWTIIIPWCLILSYCLGDLMIQGSMTTEPTFLLWLHQAYDQNAIDKYVIFRF